MSQKHQRRSPCIWGDVWSTLHPFDHTVPTHAIIDPTVRTPNETPLQLLPSSNRPMHKSHQVEPHSCLSNSCSQSKDAHRYSRCSRTELSKPKYIAPEHHSKMSKPVNTRLYDVLNFQSYYLITRDHFYDDYVASRIAKSSKLMQGQMQQNTFDLADPISPLNFLSTFQRVATVMECWNDSGTMCLSHYLIPTLQWRKSTPEASFKTPLNKWLENVLHSYFDVVNYLLAKYAIDEVMAEAVHIISSCTQPTN